MKKLTLLATCIIAMLLLAGCKGSGSAAGFAGSVFAGGSSIIDDGSGEDLGVGHTPEPATVALLGGGFAAYAFLKRKKRKK